MDFGIPPWKSLLEISFQAFDPFDELGEPLAFALVDCTDGHLDMFFANGRLHPGDAPQWRTVFGEQRLELSVVVHISSRPEIYRTHDDLTTTPSLLYNLLVILFSKPVDWFRFSQLSQLFLLEKGEQK